MNRLSSGLSIHYIIEQKWRNSKGFFTKLQATYVKWTSTHVHTDYCINDKCSNTSKEWDGYMSKGGDWWCIKCWLCGYMRDWRFPKW